MNVDRVSAESSVPEKKEEKKEEKKKKAQFFPQLTFPLHTHYDEDGKVIFA